MKGAAAAMRDAIHCGRNRKWYFLAGAGGAVGVLTALLLQGGFRAAVLPGAALDPAVPRVVRGPLLLVTSPASATVRWQLDREVPTALRYTTAGGKTTTMPVVAVEDDHQAVLSKLPPGQPFTYQVEVNGRPLGPEHTARTDPGPDASFRFVAFGDSGAGDSNQEAVARLVAKADPDLVLLLGDIIYPKGDPGDFDRTFFKPYRALLPETSFWPVLGNHDVKTEGGDRLVAEFPLPATGPADPNVNTGHNYSFNYGSAHFAAVNSCQTEETLRDVVAPWLLHDLRSSRARWKFVFLHHPPYSSGEKHGSSLKIRRALCPVFEAARVDIVFAGHDHQYERTLPLRGVTYIVSGAGGSRLSRVGRSEWTAASYDDQHGLVQVDLDDRRLALQFINRDGNVLDKSVWVKDADVSAAAATRTRTPVADG